MDLRGLRFLSLVAAFCGVASFAVAGSATDITGLYYTGVANNGSLLTGGTTDSHWTVTYAYANGVSDNPAYQGAAYVVSGSYIDYAWVQNTASAQWITAPGARTATSGGTANLGGDYLPGNGTSGTNRAQYVYTLAFTILGTGTGTVTNQVSINLTIAADDQYKIYVNPTTYTSGAVNTTSSTLGGSGYSAWNNTASVTLQNYGANANANFVIGTNYLTIVVDNTNSVTGTSSSSALNPSGLMVYQVGSAMTIDGKPIPEAGTVFPILGALGVFGWWRFRRRSVA